MKRLAALRPGEESRSRQLIATIDGPVVIQRILAHLGLPVRGPARRPRRPVLRREPSSWPSLT
jgi:hypothetical protein